MTVIPMPGVVYIRTDAAKAGVFQDDARAVEFAEVIGVGEEVTNIKVGDKIFVKSWAVDLVNHQGEWHKFVHIDTLGILAKVDE